MRLLPVLIGDKVQSPEGEVWQLTLQLENIADLICAQIISLSQVAYPEIMIQEYLESRKYLFLECTLKLHCLRHYPALILKFGLLIQLWMMRFESKHSYFKRCARHLKNFEKICHTLSKRHQMFQAYTLVGPGSSQPLHVKDSCTFYTHLYSETIKQAVSEFGFSENNVCVSTDIQYTGTMYKKGHFLLSQNDETVDFGELLVISIKNDAEVYFVMDIHTADYHSEYHLYSVKKHPTLLMGTK